MYVFKQSVVSCACNEDSDLETKSGSSGGTAAQNIGLGPCFIVKTLSSE